MRALRFLALSTSVSVLSGCWFLMEPPPTPTPAGPQQATVVTTPAAPKPPPAPDLEEVIGSDIDTKTPAVFSGLVAQMSRKEVDAFFPGVGKTTENFVEATSKNPAIHHVRFYFSDGALYSAEIWFPASTSTSELYAKLIEQGKKKWGPVDDKGDVAKWDDVKLEKKDGMFKIDVQIDEHRGKAAPLDVAAIVGAGDSSKAPAGFDPFPKTLTREDAARLGRVEKRTSTAFVTVLSEEGSMYEEIELYYSDDRFPHSVTLKLHPSLSTQDALLALRAGLEKRYGKAKKDPSDATDANVTGFAWRTPHKIRLERKEKLIEIELRYN